MENTNCFNFGGQDSMLEDTAGRDMTANPYDSNSKYKKGAICIQNNKLYEAKQNIDVAEQFTELHWTETTLGDIVSKNKSDISELTEKLSHSLHFGISNQTNYVTVNLSEIPRGVYLLFNTSSSGFNGWILVNYDNKNIFSLDNKDVNSDSTINDGVLMLNCGTWYSDIWGFCFS